MRIKLFLFFIFVLFANNSKAQSYVKANALTALVLIPNVGYETKISKSLSFQVDVNASLWKSINRQPFQFVTVIPEVRYHFKEVFNGFYFGAHIGGGYYKLRKWNYSTLNYYQEGYNYLVGGSLGYQKKLSEKCLIEFFLGGGNQQGFYKGYNSITGLRADSAKKYNKSGEWIPYRGGIMICYKLD